MVKNLPAMQKTLMRSLSQEDPLEKEMATLSRFLTWRIPWTEEPGELNPWGHKESDTTETTQFAHTMAIHQFSRSVMSDSLQPHGLQHTRLPCPSPTPGVYSNSCPLSR